jgi:hypothetical protein
MQEVEEITHVIEYLVRACGPQTVGWRQRRIAKDGHACTP